MKLYYTKYLLFICIINNSMQAMDGNPLHIAVKENNIQELKQLLVEPWNVNYKDSNGQTPLSLAMEQKNYRVMEILLLSGASPNFFVINTKI